MISVRIADKKMKMKCKKTSKTLSEIRKQIVSKQIISQSFLFSLKGKKIDKDDEDKYTLQDLLSNNRELFLQPAENEPNKPISGAKLIEKNRGLSVYEYPNQIFTDYDESRALTLVFLGEVGNGKATLLNCFVNYLLDIQMKDDFRYKIIFNNNYQPGIDKDVTEDIKIYNIMPTNGLPPIKIIDTPRFWDPREPEIRKRKEKIEDFFRNKLTKINAICFVAKSTYTKVTEGQKYMLSTIFNLLDNDAAKNFVFLLTFYQGNEAKILDALKAEKIISRKIIPKVEEISKNWFYTFNNNSIFNPEKSEMTKIFYDSTMKSFKDLSEHLQAIPQKSLIQIRQLMEQRHELESLFCYSINLLKEIEKINEIIETVKNLKSKPKNRKAIKIKEEYGENVVCENCQHNCYRGMNEVFFFNFNIFSGFKFKCKKCPGHCEKDSHKIVNYYYDYVEEENSIDYLINPYSKYTSKQSDYDSILKGLEKDRKSKEENYNELQKKITNIADKLSGISLNGNDSINSKDWIKAEIEKTMMVM